MADSTEIHVWDRHALDVWATNPAGHNCEGSPLRAKLLELKDEVVTALDLGCGLALWHKLFEGFKYIGVDQSPEMLNCARKLCPDGNFIQANAESTGLAPGSVDLVFTAAVLQHNKHARKSDVVAEIVRILKPGGYYLCTECTFRPDNFQPIFPGREFSEDLTDGYSFTASGWEKFMSARGLDLVWYETPSEYLYRKRA